LEILQGCGILAALEHPDLVGTAITRTLDGDLSADAAD
jgi:hypothetical protein